MERQHLRFGIIFAVGGDNCFGKGSGMPWPRCMADMRHFSHTTRDHLCVAGSKTFDSVKNLQFRCVVKLTTKNEKGSNVINSLDDLADFQFHPMNQKMIWILGGAEVIKSCIEDERILTISKTTIVGTYDCDTRLDLDIPPCFQQERIDYLPNRSDRPDSPDCYIEIFGRVY